MRISVIIPTLNESAYLEKCLSTLKDSQIVRNKPDNFEWFVVDTTADGYCVDETSSIASEYGAHYIISPRYKLITRDIANRSLGTGQIIVSTDADTNWPESSLGLLIEPIIAGRAIATSSPRVFESPLFLRFVSSFRRLWYVDMMFGSNSAFLREAYIESGGFNVDNLDHLNGSEVQKEEEVNFLQRLKMLGPYEYVKSAPVYCSSRRFTDSGYQKQIGIERF